LLSQFQTDGGIITELAHCLPEREELLRGYLSRFPAEQGQGKTGSAEQFRWIDTNSF
jgi:hypothetical protein